mmetsp:Transcript_19451/g.45480  ORF Transcript_19451/g.45480 Transcript_19451/m.45480 type:complete len:335 (-) Transcript_19451:37-1041(-)|eukprot:CAMPEP_0114559266 /NCGR_PEP_ID=MMETSP0114-20121206/10830_1 /TAXON_ID=31324 /ORGANISM="Goniomonas sp, Strain m" /LENGTH=334 /DNA_ID=CAMNT_0001744725 /DNA_START=55 /DNA_END=1059 /DNA_ORIENTATION=+
MADGEENSEDKISWLRAHGVEVETREDRKRASEAVAGTGGPKRVLKYVRIPADDSEPFETLETEVDETFKGDYLPIFLKSYFARGVVNSDAMHAQAVQQLGPQAANLSTKSLLESTAGGSVETFALVRPSPSNNLCGVYMYLDEVGVLKNLPRNQRASALAQSCGFDDVAFHGDLFVSRLDASVSPGRNVDFSVGDLDSGSSWLKTAMAENMEYGVQAAKMRQQMAERGGLAEVGGKLPDEQQCTGYSWKQNEEEMEVNVPVPEGTKKAALKVAIATRSLTVKVGADTVVSIELSAPIRPDESTWTLGGNVVSVTLAKVTEVKWQTLERVGVTL